MMVRYGFWGFLAVLCFAGLVRGADDDGGIIIRKNQRTLEKIEEVYSQISPVKYEPPVRRWKNLRRTRRALTNGGNLNIVMLGDSIVNDTSRSCWNLVLEKRYPKCRISRITSVRGSTGCWWYKQAGRVKKYVLDHKPDLVIIGGISHRGDIEAIRDVIGQIRESAKSDVLLMTGAFGAVDPLKDEQWLKTSDPNHYSAYRQDLEKLSREMKAGFLDMEAVWGRYIRVSGKELDWFKRDPIHANERGEQILGRILAAHLSPKN
ncbi:MAG: SGNH/GDSL hydrolase family protein [Planctomycetota bacterium]|jgi:hypothetical protein